MLEDMNDVEREADEEVFVILVTLVALDDCMKVWNYGRYDREAYEEVFVGPS